MELKFLKYLDNKLCHRICLQAPQGISDQSMEIFQTKWFQEDFQEDKKAATILSLVPGFIKARQSQLDRKPLLSISGFLWKGL